MAHRRFHRVRHHGSKALAGGKGTLFGAAAGAATAAVSGYAQTAIPFLSTGGWWAMPTALALVGHFLKRKNPTIGGAIIGIAGYQAYANFVNAKAVPTTAKGFIDAGAMSYADAGALVDPGSTRYLDSPRTVSSLGTSSAQDAGMLINRETMGVDDAMGLES